jgi:hypothetical protein
VCLVQLVYIVQVLGFIADLVITSMPECGVPCIVLIFPSVQFLFHLFGTLFLGTCMFLNVLSY